MNGNMVIPGAPGRNGPAAGQAPNVAMSATATVGDFKRALDEKVEKFISEVFHSSSGQFWARQVLHWLLRADIADRVGDIVGGLLSAKNLEALNGEKSFEFAGEGGECELARAGVPHAPHLVGSYQTVRYGAMDIYCLGKSGYLQLWDYTIHVQVDARRLKGGARGKVRVEVTA